MSFGAVHGYAITDAQHITITSNSGGLFEVSVGDAVLVLDKWQRHLDDCAEKQKSPHIGAVILSFESKQPLSNDLASCSIDCGVAMLQNHGGALLKLDRDMFLDILRQAKLLRVHNQVVREDLHAIAVQNGEIRVSSDSLEISLTQADQKEIERLIATAHELPPDHETMTPGIYEISSVPRGSLGRPTHFEILPSQKFTLVLAGGSGITCMRHTLEQAIEACKDGYSRPGEAKAYRFEVRDCTTCGD